MKRLLFCLLAMIVVLGLSRPAMATLIDRGSFAYNDGAGHTGFVNLVYDQDIDMTWVGDGNFAQTTGFDADGKMSWDVSVFGWVNRLTIGDFTDWALPSRSGAEMNHLFFNELGGTPGNPISVSGDPDLALFPNLQDFNYWTGTSFRGGNAWSFNFANGALDLADMNNGFYALAVRSGDVAASTAVPEPATVALLGIGLAGMGVYGVRRRRRRR